MDKYKLIKDRKVVANTTEGNTYVLLFNDHSIGVKVKRTSLEDVYLSFICDVYNELGIEPDFIILPSKVKIQYHNYYFHRMYDHGGIDEKEMIQDLLIIDKN